MQPHLLVPQQVPEFVRAEYPAFLEFIKAYYQWLSTEVSIGKIEDLVDVDSTVDGFLQYFRKQLDVYGITAQTEDRLYLRHIKELYASKGSSASYEFLFKILFNKSSNVVTPWDSVFIPSNGNWKQDTSLLVNIPATVNINLLEGNPITATSISGLSYKTFVRNANRRSDGVVELFVSRIIHDETLVNVRTESGSLFPIFTTTLRVVIEKPGTGFRVGQVFEVDSYGGAGTLCKVKSVNSGGGITSVDIIRFGVGYNTDFNLLISPQTVLDTSIFNSRITLGEFSYATNDIASAQNEAGSVVRHTYTNYTNLEDSYMTDATYVGETVGEIKHQEQPIYEGVNYASVRFIVGQLCVYPGYYTNSNNIIGDIAYIQDSYFYQVYSYVTEVEEALDSYSKILRSVLHPAGAKHFGTHQLNNVFQLNVEVDPSLNLLTREDALRDFVDTVDLIVFAFAKTLSDNVTLTDVAVTSVQYNRTLPASVVSLGDIASFEVNLGQIDDVVSITDSILFIPGLELAPDFVTISDASVINVDKYATDTVQTNMAGYLYMTPFYVLQEPPYWQAGYLENERELTN